MDELLTTALLAGIAIAVVTAPLGCVVVWRRMAYFGDTLSHAALLGIALAIAADGLPLAGVLLVGTGIAALLFWLEKKRSLSTDTLLGILSHTALAMGLIVISLLQADGRQVNLMAYLFGDILSLEAADMPWLLAGMALVLLLFYRLWPALLSLSVDEELARVDGVAVDRTRLVFMLLLAAVIAAAIPVVGVLLITALLIIPPATARLLSRSPKQMLAVTMAVSVLAVSLGLLASWQWDLPAGPAMVAAAAAMFFLSRGFFSTAG